MANSWTLQFSARLALFGLSYVYIVKLIDTFWHGIFSDPAVSFAIVSLNIIAGITQFLFFCKLKSSTSNNGVLLDIAGWSGIIGALINILPKLLALSVLLQFYFSFNLIKNSQLIAVLSPWLGAVMLFFSCLLHFLLKTKIGNSKTRAFLFGTTGYMILTVTFSMLVLNYYSGQQVNWQEGEIGLSLTYFIISGLFSFICIASFYAGFLVCNESIETAETH